MCGVLALQWQQVFLILACFGAFGVGGGVCCWISHWNECQTNIRTTGDRGGNLLEDKDLLSSQRKTFGSSCKSHGRTLVLKFSAKNLGPMPVGWAAANTVKGQSKYSSVEQTKAGLSPSDICYQAIHQFINNNSSKSVSWPQTEAEVTDTVHYRQTDRPNKNWECREDKKIKESPRKNLKMWCWKFLNNK